MTKNIIRSIVEIGAIMAILFCQTNDGRILSPYNTIPGYELDDWTKSPDFGVIHFTSNYPTRKMKFDRIEPSEGVDKFLWKRDFIALPYGSYKVTIFPSNNYFDDLDTLIFVERQKTKEVELQLKLKTSPILNYTSFNMFSGIGVGSLLYGIYYIIGVQIRESTDVGEIDLALLSLGTYGFLLDYTAKRYWDIIKDNNKLKNKLLIPHTEEPKIITPLKPIYPKKAFDLGLEGAVIVRAFIDKNGDAKEVKAIRGNSLFKKNSEEALKNAKFQPALNGANPVGVWIEKIVKYEISDWVISRGVNKKIETKELNKSDNTKSKNSEAYLISPIILDFPVPDIPKGMEIIIDIMVFIDASGSPKNPYIFNTDKDNIITLNNAALEAVRKAKYKPEIKDDIKVESWIKISVKFVSR